MKYKGQNKVVTCFNDMKRIAVKAGKIISSGPIIMFKYYPR